jgi:MYXO-CTERM domain-containing protein
MVRLGWLVVVMVSSSLLVVAGPRLVQACQPDPCESVDQFHTFASTQSTIATDGVIAFEYTRGIGQLDEPQALAYVDVVVADDMGMEIPGALEPWTSSGIAVWRPSAPLPADTSLQVTITVDNASIAAATAPRWMDCNPDLALDLPLVTSSGPLPAIASHGITPISELVQVHDFHDITQLVCCDGAYPTIDALDCFGDGSARWAEGHCATTIGQTRIEAGFEFEPLVATDAHDDLLAVMVGGAGWTVRSGIGEPSVTTWDNEPFCAHLDVWSIARGTRVSTDEVCFGDEVADELGDTVFDPSLELAEQCSADPYTCAVERDDFGGQWNPNDCEPWPADAGDTSGADASGDAGDADASAEAGSADDASTADDGDDAPGTASGDGGESSGSGAQDGVADRGCACASDPRSDATGAFGLIVLAALRRRRSPHSATNDASGS